MPLISKGNKIIEKETGKVVGKSKDARSARNSAILRNKILEKKGRKKRMPRPRPQNSTPIAAVRG